MADLPFSLDQDQLHRIVAGVLQQVRAGRGKLRFACLDATPVLLPVGKSELNGGVGELHRNGIGMVVHDRLLVRAIV
ncbi:MAG: hypothetical protein WCA20_37740 [Candidatus Sulfotelmatobacter sp.]